MKIKEVYEKYKHLDPIIQDFGKIKDDYGDTILTSKMLTECWNAIKIEATK